MFDVDSQPSSVNANRWRVDCQVPTPKWNSGYYISFMESRTTTSRYIALVLQKKSSHLYVFLFGAAQILYFRETVAVMRPLKYD